MAVTEEGPPAKRGYTRLLEAGWLPDRLIRFGIRRLVGQRLRLEAGDGLELQEQALNAFIQEMKRSPIALATAAANSQHYEVPSAFFQLVLGRRMKYSCAYWPAGILNLDEAELAMLQLTVSRAGIANGQRILELGCGWGSLSIYMAQAFPHSEIVAVSNSSSQRKFVGRQARHRGLTNLTVITADMNDFHPEGTFDRVVSIEMFEHMRNWEALLRRVATWMKDDARLFIHVFTHCRHAYPFVDRDESDWIARHFFTGGLMPSAELLLHFQDHLRVERRWQLDGTHYQKTAESWLLNMEINRKRISPILHDTYGQQARRFHAYWRVFFMACAVQWGYRHGQEWTVSHYLMNKRAAAF